ncbi:PD-(D/E)XK nuclease-like domain-containing protein [Kineosporia succinea]|uniref:PD-(D/E)XK nuclease-like domain-containing protein n=1 Tax=Kineosporia succinea TaxID=84632 RepID=UPI0027D78F11|nr:PD-(D/E)XK nuclease-like domain-containing protein [Kineosporia succinea]
MTETLEPGLHDIPEAEYHADPVPGGSASSSTLRKMLAPSAPAVVQWERENDTWKPQYDFGSVAHKLLLGRGAEVHIVNREVWNTNEVKAEVKAAREAGLIPIKASDYRRAQEVEKAVRRHPIAHALLEPGSGMPERTIIWRDAETGQWCRAMLDWLSLLPGQQPVIVDVKTTGSGIDRRSITNTIAKFGYHQQDAFYRTAVESLGYDRPWFFFVFITSTPPHQVAVVSLDDISVVAGHEKNRTALALWAECRRTGEWPGVSTDLETITLPNWAITEAYA